MTLVLSSDLAFPSSPSSSFFLSPPPQLSSPFPSPLLPSPRSQGGLLWSVVPELLLDYQDYQQWLKDGGVVTGSAFHPESEEEFLEASRQAWTHLLMQIIKVSSIFTLLLYKWRNGINSH